MTLQMGLALGALLFQLFVHPIVTHAQPSFDRNEALKEWNNIRQKPPIAELEILGQPKGPKAKAFLKHFRDRIYPKMVEFQKLEHEQKALRLGLDMALYSSDQEKEEWQKQYVEVLNQFNANQTDREWEKTVLKWSKLARGLDGDLPDFAQRLAETTELEAYPKEAMPLLDELNQLEVKVNEVANNYPLAEQRIEATTDKAEIHKDFSEGNLSFNEASKQAMVLALEGELGYGHYVSETAKDDLNRSAVIRSELAKIKGFDSWAAFAVAHESSQYSAEFQTVEARIEFLNQILDVTDTVFERLMRERKRQVIGNESAKIHMTQISLLFQSADLTFDEYFPSEKLVDVWKQLMLDSGFSEEALDHIHVDAYPRKGKFTHAYMMPYSSTTVKKFTVDSETLDVHHPYLSSDNWFEGHTYILQNFDGDGPSPLKTALHEGGHGLDFLYRMNVLGYSAGVGYAETHSMTMEHFLNDPEVLLGIAKNRQNQAPSREMVDKFLAHSSLIELFILRNSAANSLFDLLVWNHDYSEGSETLIERMHRLARDIMERAFMVEADPLLDIPMGSLRFVTGHFYDGYVSYFGYTVAYMAADMTAKALSERLLERTGRSSWYQQPDIAEILIEEYYKHGFEKPFPRSIEDFTNRPFSPETFANKIIERTDAYIKESQGLECSSLLTKKNSGED